VPNMEMELASRGAALRSRLFADSMSAAARSSFPIRSANSQGWLAVRGDPKAAGRVGLMFAVIGFGRLTVLGFRG